MIKTNEKGITLMALMVYIIIMLVVLVILATINNTYRQGVTEMKKATIIEEEFSEFNLYFLEETKKTNNKVVITDEETSEKSEYNSNETLQSDTVEFSTGSIFSWEDPDSDGIYSIYLSKGTEKFEIAYNVEKNGETNIFTVSQSASGNTQIIVSVILNNTQKVITYVLSNKEMNNEQFESDYGDSSVPIPEGFYYVGGVKQYGVVISDNVADKNRYKDYVDVGIDLDGNQFVWIPVDNPNDMYGIDNSDKGVGKLYTFTQESTNNCNWVETNGKTTWIDSVGYREPANLGIDNANNINEWENLLFQTEFEEMIASVRKYGGFYIGRYETGGLNAEKAVVKAGEGNESINKATWYTIYNKTKTLSTINTTVSMIWGCQWDQVMKIINEKKDGNKDDYIVYRKKTNRHTGIIANAGSNLNDKVYNIYDLEGNVYEFTQEAYDTNKRTRRGGSYIDSGSAAARSSDEPSGSGPAYRESCYTLYKYIMNSNYIY